MRHTRLAGGRILEWGSVTGLLQPGLSPNLAGGRPPRLPVQPTPSVVWARPCRLDGGNIRRVETTWISGWGARATGPGLLRIYRFPPVSFPRKREPNAPLAREAAWVPAFAGRHVGSGCSRVLPLRSGEEPALGHDPRVARSDGRGRPRSACCALRAAAPSPVSPPPPPFGWSFLASNRSTGATCPCGSARIPPRLRRRRGRRLRASRLEKVLLGGRIKSGHDGRGCRNCGHRGRRLHVRRNGASEGQGMCRPSPPLTPQERMRNATSVRN
jgi:hypothetical protein